MMRFLLCIFWLLPASLYADETLDEKLASLREEAVSLSQSLKEMNRDSRRKENQLKQWKAEEAALTQALNDEEARLSSVLSRMMQASKAAPISVMNQSSDIDWIRQAKLMDMTSQNLREQSRELRNELAEIDRLRRVITEEEGVLTLASHAMAERYAKLQALMQQRQMLVNQQQSVETKMQRVERRRLALQTRTIEGLLNLIEKDSGVKMVRSPEFITMRAGLIPSEGVNDLRFQLPVRGVVLSQFGDVKTREEGGGVFQSVRIRARPRSMIYAPEAGEVVFSGPFRSYGSMLLIKHEGGYMSRISGFAEPAVVVGQRVVRGEPIGYMQRSGKTVASFELRKERKAIDPMPLIAHSIQ